MITRIALLSILLTLAVAGLIAAGGKIFRLGRRVPANKEMEMPSPAAEYAKILNNYRGIDSAMDIAGTIRIYDGDRNNQLREMRTFRCYHYRQRYYWQLSYLKTFCDGRVAVQLDTVSRVITVTKAPSGEDANRVSANMQPALLFGDSAKVHLSGNVELSGRERVLILRGDFRPDVKECRIFYDTTGYSLQHAEIEWWKNRTGPLSAGPGKVWLAKLDYSRQKQPIPDIDGGVASIISMRDGKIKATPQYQDYKVNVNL